jgi:hypothetical protein
MEIQVTSRSDVVSWNEQFDCVYAQVANYYIGFYKPYGVFAYLPRGALPGTLTEPAIYIMTRPWFKIDPDPWDVFNTNWSTTETDYASIGGGDWDGANIFGWTHEFDVRDPPTGTDVEVRNYVEVLANHQSFAYRTYIKPFVALDNIGLEYAHFIKTSYVSYIDQVFVEKSDGSINYYPIAQAKDIKGDVPDSVAKFGFVLSNGRHISQMDMTKFPFDTWEIRTQQLNIGGTDFWVFRCGGVNVGSPRPVSVNETVRF